MRYVTASEMKEIDRTAIKKGGIPAKRLMENAGRAVADEAMKVCGKTDVIIFAGYGNNGGDGLVAARYLSNKGCGVKVYFVGKARSFSPETNDNLEKLFRLNIQPGFISKKEELYKVFDKIKKPGLVIDAIFGTGIKGRLEDFYIEAINKINALKAPIIAADLPSGLDADTGEALGAAVRATKTVTMGYPKVGFKNPAAKEYVGDLVVADIGFSKIDTAKSQASSSIPVIRLRKGKKGRIREGHPWIYKGQVLNTGTAARPGAVVRVTDADGKFIGKGYYNPKSEIAIRLLTFSDEELDKNFFDNKIRDAAKKREWLAARTNAYRAVFSEADGLPGLIVDIYADTAVFQIMTLGMEGFKDIIIQGIKGVLNPKYIYEKSDSPFRKIEGLKEEKMWHGEKRADPMIEIFEGKARFLVDIENGHKTGFYLDQRRSRMALEGISKDKKVLDLFCYTGAFLITGALSGAREALGLDIKEDWLELAGKNADLNGVSEKVEFRRGDAFEALEGFLDSGEKFDIIIIDPPSFLKDRSSLVSASKGYRQLNLAAMKLLTEGGTLATFSCSHNMPNKAFSDILKDAGQEAGKKLTILKRCHQAEDHPIARNIPETEYLKGYFFRVGDV